MATGSDGNNVITETINAYCRVRPPSESLIGEATSNVASYLSIFDDGTCKYNTSEKREVNFKLSGCFGFDSTQNDIFEKVAQPIVDSAIRGYNGTILAYGPTNSGAYCWASHFKVYLTLVDASFLLGKTFTMRGRDFPHKDLGIIPRYSS